MKLKKKTGSSIIATMKVRLTFQVQELMHLITHSDKRSRRPTLSLENEVADKTITKMQSPQFQLNIKTTQICTGQSKHLLTTWFLKAKVQYLQKVAKMSSTTTLSTSWMLTREQMSLLKIRMKVTIILPRRHRLLKTTASKAILALKVTPKTYLMKILLTLKVLKTILLVKNKSSLQRWQQTTFASKKCKTDARTSSTSSCKPSRRPSSFLKLRKKAATKYLQTWRKNRLKL